MPECSNVLPWKSLDEIKTTNNFKKMVYFIKSSVGNFERRNLVRSTWGSVYRLVNKVLVLVTNSKFLHNILISGIFSFKVTFNDNNSLSTI